MNWSQNNNVKDLWLRGKYWEIFGFTSSHFTSLEMAKRYSIMINHHSGPSGERQIVEEAFSILNAPLKRGFYTGCRLIMMQIQREIDATAYINHEEDIWSDLWGWVSQRWQAPSEELIKALKIKYVNAPKLGTSKSTTRQRDVSQDESKKSANIDSLMAAESFKSEVKCQGCGKFDQTLRVVAFPYIISVLITSFKRFNEAGIFCHRCRCEKSTKWAVASLLFGWWSIPGFFWTIEALVDNYKGGKILKENNEPLVSKLAWAYMILGKIAEAKSALKDLLKQGGSKEAISLKQELDRTYPEISPTKIGGFRLGYLTVVFAVLGAYVIAGTALFGGSASSPNSVPYQPVPVSPAKTTPVYPVSDSYPPDKSFVKWNNSSKWTSSTTATISGTVTNTHNKWSITSVRIEVETLNSYGAVVQQRTVSVSPSTIAPGSSGTYYQLIATSTTSENINTVLRWTWLPPQ